MSAKIEQGLTYTLLGATVLIRTINGQRVLPLEDIDFLFDKPAGSTQEVFERYSTKALKFEKDYFIWGQQPMLTHSGFEAVTMLWVEGNRDAKVRQELLRSYYIDRQTASEPPQAPPSSKKELPPPDTSNMLHNVPVTGYMVKQPDGSYELDPERSTLVDIPADVVARFLIEKFGMTAVFSGT